MDYEDSSKWSYGPTSKPTAWQFYGIECGSRAAGAGPHDIGPDLKPLNRRGRWWRTWGYIFRRHGIQIFIFIPFMAILLYITRAWEELSFPWQLLNATAALPVAAPTSLVDYIGRWQTYLAVGTLLVAISIWYGRIRDEWENTRPKRMSVFFFMDDKPHVVIRYVWLADAGDMRAWGQQVARQAVHGQQLDFSPDIEARTSLEKWTNGDPFMHYAVCFKLTGLNDYLRKNQGICRYQNLAAGFKDVQSIPLEKVARLRAVSEWKLASKS